MHYLHKNNILAGTHCSSIFSGIPEMTDVIFEKLKNLSISYITYSHPPVFTIEQAQAVASEIPGALCKNLFLKDSKGKFYLVVADHATQISLKKLSKHIHAPELR